jgi:electron transfer flavoprotein beta subunit
MPRRRYAGQSKRVDFWGELSKLAIFFVDECSSNPLQCRGLKTPTKNVGATSNNENITPPNKLGGQILRQEKPPAVLGAKLKDERPYKEISVGYKCVVLIKQVPDTKKITGKAMNDDGTVNRKALPAIFNPEDLNALELALEIRTQYGGTVTVITMGLPAAAEILRDSLYRGADRVILITDQRCAASDTLATSYILSCAINKLEYDIVICGRQAIDGDTAQVGPQLAEKLGITQITYVEKLGELENEYIIAQRNIGNGQQQVHSKLPVLLTVTGDANEPRVAAAKRLMKYKNAKVPIEIEQQIKTENPNIDEDTLSELVEEKCRQLEDKGLLIEQWDLDFLEADLGWCGRSGSPTKVHRIQSIVLAAKESKDVEPTGQGIAEMIHELIEDKTIA